MRKILLIGCVASLTLLSGSVWELTGTVTTNENGETSTTIEGKISSLFQSEETIFSSQGGGAIDPQDFDAADFQIYLDETNINLPNTGDLDAVLRDASGNPVAYQQFGWTRSGLTMSPSDSVGINSWVSGQGNSGLDIRRVEINADYSAPAVVGLNVLDTELRYQGTTVATSQASFWYSGSCFGEQTGGFPNEEPGDDCFAQ